MHALIALGIFAFLLCLAITPIFREIFLHAGLVDQPDTERKFHQRAVPRVGGIPIAISYAGALLLVFFLKPGGGTIYIQHRQLFHAVLPAAALIFATGLLDDLVGLKPWQKLAGQGAASVLAVSLGARLALTHYPGWLSIVISIVWLIGCSNAVNLIDGMDGLATGVGLFATVTTILVALLSGNVGLALVTVPLAGSLLAFLRYNFCPASVFLGDCGSLSIGFVLGCFGLVWSQRSGTMLGMAAPVMALSLPLIDVSLAIGRRFLRSVPIFKGDRGHIHHMILRRGFSTRGAALLLYGVCGISAALAILESFSRGRLGWPIVIIFWVLVVAGVNRLGYVEFSAARKTFSHKTMRRAVQEEIYLEELSRDLLQAETIEAWWSIIRKACGDMRFASAQLELDGQAFFEQFATGSDKPMCRIHLGFGERGYLLLTRRPEQAPPRIMMTVLDHLHYSAEQRARVFQPRDLAITSPNAA